MTNRTVDAVGCVVQTGQRGIKWSPCIQTRDCKFLAVSIRARCEMATWAVRDLKKVEYVSKVMNKNENSDVPG